MTKISAVIPDDLAAALKERARAEDRSAGAVVRRALIEHVSRPIVGVTSRPDHAVVESGQRNTGARR